MILHEIEKTSFTIGPFTIQSDYVIHPGPTVGFRIQHQRGIFTYIPDHESALGPNGLMKDLTGFLAVNLRWVQTSWLHDAQYTSEEYQAKQGWGHSSMEDAIQFAGLSRANRHLLLTHHDPMHTDAELHKIIKRLKNSISCHVPYELAVEGSRIEL